MIVFPTTVEEALAAQGTYRAGGTELQERRRLPNLPAAIGGGDLVDLRDTEGLDELRYAADGTLRIGAKTRMATVGDHADLRVHYPGFAEAVGGLATPQIRAVGTMAGNLLQRTRCWYFRAPQTQDRCFKRGGNTCSARAGDHTFHSCFDLGPCASVHPSTIAMAMLAYDGLVDVAPGGLRSVATLLGDGSDARSDNQLQPGELITSLVLPAPRAGEQSAYFRAISRARSEWPLVEVLVRLVVEGGVVAEAAIAMGGVAPVPLRASSAETALLGRKPDVAVLTAAAKAATEGAAPLPMTGYKLELVEGSVLETLERALARDAVVLASSVNKLPRPPAGKESP